MLIDNLLGTKYYTKHFPSGIFKILPIATWCFQLFISLGISGLSLSLVVVWAYLSRGRWDFISLPGWNLCFQHWKVDS